MNAKMKLGLLVLGLLALAAWVLVSILVSISPDDLSPCSNYGLDASITADCNGITSGLPACVKGSGTIELSTSCSGGGHYSFDVSPFTSQEIMVAVEYNSGPVTRTVISECPNTIDTTCGFVVSYNVNQPQLYRRTDRDGGSYVPVAHPILTGNIGVSTSGSGN